MDDRKRLAEASEWVRTIPRSIKQYDYIVTAGIRLMFFWYSRDDVGSGYLREGMGEGEIPPRVMQLLMGSDPEKAPMKINRWGAAIEMHRPQEQAGAFFGFMKPSKGRSAAEMKGEIERESADRRYLFEGIIARTDSKRALSVTVPIRSSLDFTIHNLADAEKMVYDSLQGAPGPFRVLEGETLRGCGGAPGFLFTVRALIDSALEEQTIPARRCYAYNGRTYSMQLEHLRPVSRKSIRVSRHNRPSPVDATYENLCEGDFRVLEDSTGNSEKFQILFGSSGRLKGVPVQVRYQPNWWFRITLNLDPASPALQEKDGDAVTWSESCSRRQ
jgi:hypothetical protein